MKCDVCGIRCHSDWTSDYGEVDDSTPILCWRHYQISVRKEMEVVN